MRWGVFTVVLLAICVVQPGFLATYSIPLFGPLDLFLALALFCGLVAPARDAPLAGWMVGLAMDLCGSGALGARAVALGLAALVISRLREWLKGDLWWLQILICVVVGSAAGFVTDILNAVHHRLWYAAGASDYGEWVAGVRATIPAALLVALIIGIRRASVSHRWSVGVFGRRWSG